KPDCEVRWKTEAADEGIRLLIRDRRLARISRDQSVHHAETHSVTRDAQEPVHARGARYRRPTRTDGPQSAIRASEGSRGFFMRPRSGDGSRSRFGEELPSMDPLLKRPTQRLCVKRVL